MLQISTCLCSTKVCASDLTCLFSRLFCFMTSCIKSRDCGTSVLITTLLEINLFSSGNKVLTLLIHSRSWGELLLLSLQVKKFSLETCRIDGLVVVAILFYLNFPYTELILKKNVKYLIFKATHFLTPKRIQLQNLS